MQKYEVVGTNVSGQHQHVVVDVLADDGGMFWAKEDRLGCGELMPSVDQAIRNLMESAGFNVHKAYLLDQIGEVPAEPDFIEMLQAVFGGEMISLGEGIMAMAFEPLTVERLIAACNRMLDEIKTAKRSPMSFREREDCASKGADDPHHDDEWNAITSAIVEFRRYATVHDNSDPAYDMVQEAFGLITAAGKVFACNEPALAVPLVQCAIAKLTSVVS